MIKRFFQMMYWFEMILNISSSTLVLSSLIFCSFPWLITKIHLDFLPEIVFLGLMWLTRTYCTQSESISCYCYHSFCRASFLSLADKKLWFKWPTRHSAFTKQTMMFIIHHDHFLESRFLPSFPPHLSLLQPILTFKNFSLPLFPVSLFPVSLSLFPLLPSPNVSSPLPPPSPSPSHVLLHVCSSITTS